MLKAEIFPPRKLSEYRTVCAEFSAKDVGCEATGNGDPAAAVRAPVLGSTENTAIWFADSKPTNTNWLEDDPAKVIPFGVVKVPVVKLPGTAVRIPVVGSMV
jgi:hypothetical protein